jgi:hypothetical protein
MMGVAQTDTTEVLVIPLAQSHLKVITVARVAMLLQLLATVEMEPHPQLQAQALQGLVVEAVGHI